ncbi:MAG: PstC family ABC transporter permease [Bdellovibrionales bacterium]|nr:PstC family ABC transporter permease [Bdellovibrionales bacterium]
MKGHNIGDILFFSALRLVSWLTVLLFVGMLVFIGHLAWDAISEKGISFWWGFEWNPPMDEFGAAPFIVGTLASSAIAVAIATPISIGTALFLREIAPRRIASIAAFLVELLAAIPSVVYGLWGVFVLAPLMRENIQPFLSKWFGPETYFAAALGHLLTAIAYPFLLVGDALGFTQVTLSSLSAQMMAFSQGVFDGAPLGLGLLTSGVVLAIMITPTVTAISREVLLTVPDSVREAALGLGATRWEMIRLALLRTGRAGLVGAVILGLGRAIGETMAVTMVIGNRNEVPQSFFDPAQTMASVIANEYNEADGLHLSSLAFVGLSLFVISLIVNFTARLVIRYLDGKGKA